VAVAVAGEHVDGGDGPDQAERGSEGRYRDGGPAEVGRPEPDLSQAGAERGG
jgi:hypothetical protein